MYSLRFFGTIWARPGPLRRGENLQEKCALFYDHVDIEIYVFVKYDVFELMDVMFGSASQKWMPLPWKSIQKVRSKSKCMVPLIKSSFFDLPTLCIRFLHSYLWTDPCPETSQNQSIFSNGWMATQFVAFVLKPGPVRVGANVALMGPYVGPYGPIWALMGPPGQVLRFRKLSVNFP